MLPDTDSVWDRVAKEDDGGRSSMSRPTVVAEPRSTWNHCGDALSVLSQQVLVLPSTALPGTQSCVYPPWPTGSARRTGDAGGQVGKRAARLTRYGPDRSATESVSRSGVFNKGIPLRMHDSLHRKHSDSGRM